MFAVFCMEHGKMPQKMFHSKKNPIFYEFLKIVKSTPSKHDRAAKLLLSKSEYSVICEVIPGHWPRSCLGQSLLLLQDRKCRMNALFLDATTGQTRKRAYPFIQFLFTWLMTRSQKNKEMSRLPKIKACFLETHEILGGAFETPS